MTYRSIAILALSIIPLYLYFKFSEDKSKKRIEIVSRGTAGKSLVGGKFHLVGTDGIPVSDEDFKDHYKLIYFGYTYCPDICPQELEKTSEALNILYSNPEFQNVKIVPLFISCDPKRDSLKSIKEYLLDFHPSFIGLSGTPDQIKATAKTFRIYYSSPPQSVDEDDVDYIVDHSTFTYLMSPDMQYLTHFSINDTPKRVAEVITDAVKGINVSQF